MAFPPTAPGCRKGHNANPNGRITPILTLAPALLLFAVLSGCTQASVDATAQAERDAPNNAAKEALTAWWKDTLPEPPPPIKTGTVTPAHTITLKTGRVLTIPRHVQTKQEADEQAEDARWVDHERAVVQGFDVKGQTVTVITDLTRASVDLRDAREICRNLGGFVWANENRHFGLQNIKVTGANGELLSSRTGLSGKVQ